MDLVFITSRIFTIRNCQWMITQTLYRSTPFSLFHHFHVWNLFKVQKKRFYSISIQPAQIKCLQLIHNLHRKNPFLILLIKLGEPNYWYSRGSKVATIIHNLFNLQTVYMTKLYLFSNKNLKCFFFFSFFLHHSLSSCKYFEKLLIFV